MHRLRALTSQSWPISGIWAAAGRRHILSDRIRSGQIVKLEKRFFRVVSNTRSQKGQNAASFHIKLAEVGTTRTKSLTANSGTDYNEAHYERLKLLFSGFDNDDFGCFVYPQHTQQAGKEVNIPAKELSELQQKYLCVGMPVEVLHIMDEDEQERENHIYSEVTMRQSEDGSYVAPPCDEYVVLLCRHP